jgi:hypothetical protein
LSPEWKKQHRHGSVAVRFEEVLIKDTIRYLERQSFYLCHWLSHRTPPRRSYHDRQWAAKMKEIGLQPSTTGEPGGKETGSSVTH